MIVVQNAVKFTPENGEIHVWMNEKCLDDSTSLLEFRCKDNGIGMSQDFIKHAYDLFESKKIVLVDPHIKVQVLVCLLPKNLWSICMEIFNWKVKRVLELRFQFRFL